MVFGMVRILCLGNEILSDDAFGFHVAQELEWRFPQIEVLFSSKSGLHLLDYLTDTQLLVIVDTIVTGESPPGTVYIMRNSDIKPAMGPSPHYVGIMETLQLARELLLKVPEDVIILAVEAADCVTLGGAMHVAVKTAIPQVVNLAAELAVAGQPRTRTTRKIPGTVLGGPL